MSGIRIDVDASGAIKSLSDFRKALNDSGVVAKSSDRELAALADRFRDKLAADKAAASLDAARKRIEQIGIAAGLSGKELDRLHQKMGTSSSSGNMFSGISNSFSSISSGVQSSIQSFSGLGGVLTGLASKLLVFLGVYKTVKEAISFTSESILTSARYQTLGVAIETLGVNMGYTTSQMHAFDAGMQRTGISMLESREALAKMTLAGIDLSKSMQLANIAQGAAIITGRSTGEALERIVQGIVTGQTRLLRNQGLLVSVEQSYKKFADTLGVDKDALTETEKAQAVLNAVLEQGSRTNSIYSESMQTAGKQLTSFKRYISDLKVVVGDSFLDSFTATVFDSADAIKKLKDIMETPEAKAAIEALSSSVFGLASTIINAIPGAVEEIVKLVSALRDLRNFLPGNFGDLGKWAVAAYDKTTEVVSGVQKAFTQAKIDVNIKLRDSTDDPNLINMYQERVDKYTKELENMSKAADLASAHNQKTVLPDSAIEHIKAESDARAAVNKVLREQNDILAAADNVREKNKANLAPDVQRENAFKTYQSDNAKIDRAIKVAQTRNDSDEVKKLYEARTAVANTYKKTLDSIDKAQNKGKSGAAAGQRFESRADSALTQAQDQYDQLIAQYKGDALGAQIEGINKKYDKMADSIRTATIGAKGSTEDYNKTLAQLNKNKALEIKIAEMNAWKKSMQDAASLQSKLGQLSGNPQAIYNSQMISAQLWKFEQEQKLSSVPDDSERAKRQVEIDKVYQLEKVNATRQAYQELAGVSNKYWNAQQEYIQNHLDAVKSEASSELAYKVYAAQQWDDFNKTKMESQVQYAQTYSQMFAAKWALAFGTYKSELGQAKDSWAAQADNIIELNKGLISSVSGGFSDYFRKVAKGTATAGDLWESMCNRMLDAVANFVDKAINDQLSRLLSSLGTSSFGGLFSGLFGGSTASSSASVNTAYNWSSAITTPFAKGGAFTSSSLPVNTIADTPTYFPLSTAGYHTFAVGTGVYGEAGPEAIVPLKRMSNNELGVQMTGKQFTTPNITFNVQNRTGQEIKMSNAKTEQNENEIVVTMLLDAIGRNVGGSRTALQSVLGLK